MSTTMDQAISALVTSAQASAANSTAEELIYLAKAIASIAPGSEASFLIHTGEDQVNQINTAGTDQVNSINSTGTTNVNTINSTATTRKGEIAAVQEGLKSISVFTSSGTWTRPSGVTSCLVQVVGGGGGAGHDGGGGTGGSSYFGNGCRGQHNNTIYDTEGAPGGGGGSSHTSHGRGGNGMTGLVIIYGY